MIVVLSASKLGFSKRDAIGEKHSTRVGFWGLVSFGLEFFSPRPRMSWMAKE